MTQKVFKREAQAQEEAQEASGSYSVVAEEDGLTDMKGRELKQSSLSQS